MIEDEGIAAKQEATLFNVIEKVDTLVWQINGKIFGEKPEKADTRPSALNNLIEARENLLDITGRLVNINKALEVIK